MIFCRLVEPGSNTRKVWLLPAVGLMLTEPHARRRYLHIGFKWLTFHAWARVCRVPHGARLPSGLTGVLYVLPSLWVYWNPNWRSAGIHLSFGAWHWHHYFKDPSHD